MDLDALLKENPGADTELQARIKAATDAGIKAVRDDQAEVMKYITSGSYPKAIVALAGQVLAGTEERSALTACVTMHDAKVEHEKSEAAKLEAAATGETAAGSTELSGDGVIRTADDSVAAVAKIKGVV